MSLSIYDLFKLTPYREKREVEPYKKTVEQIILDFLKDQDWRIYENANRAKTYYSLLSHLAQHAIAIYSLDKLPKEYAYGHKTGWWHIHDLGVSGVFIRYCSGLDLGKLLLDGFKPVLSNTTTSVPAKHLSTVLDHLLNFFTIFSHECAGAVSVASLDIYCAPFIREDRFYYANILGLDPYSEQMNKFMEKYVYQCVQRFIWNLNYPLRAGFEALFTNITLDLSAKKSGLADRPVIIGGKIHPDKYYRDYQEEVNLFNKCLLDVKYKGTPEGRNHTFPIITINITDDFEEILTEEIKDLIYKCSAKYGEFYFQNCVSGELGLKNINPNDVRSMAFLPDQRLIVKLNGKIRYIPIKKLYNLRNGNIEVLMSGKFYKVVDVYEIDYKNYNNYVEVKLENGYVQSFSWDHKCVVVRNGKIREVLAQDIDPSRDKFMLSIDEFEGYDMYNSPLYIIISNFILYGSYTQEPYNRILIKFTDTKKFENLKKHLTQCVMHLEDNFIVVEINDQSLISILSNMIDFVNLRFKDDFFTQKLEFRKKVFDGLFGDGMLVLPKGDFSVDDIIALASSVGEILKVTDDGQVYIIEKYKPEKFIKYNGKKYALVDIVKVDKIRSKFDNVYDFTIDRDDHLFELPNGIITHQCCRLNLDKTEIYRRVGGFFSGGENVGSICVTTLNLPRYGYVAKNFMSNKSIEDVMYNLSSILDRVFDVVIKGAVRRKELILEYSTKKYDLAPFIKAYEHPDMPTYFITVGFVGLNECLINMGLEGGLAKEKNITYAEKIMDMLLSRVKKYQEKYDTLINLEATPAEGAGTRLAKLDKYYFFDRLKSKT